MTLQKSYDFCYVRLALFCSSEILNGVAQRGAVMPAQGGAPVGRLPWADLRLPRWGEKPIERNSKTHTAGWYETTTARPVEQAGLLRDESHAEVSVTTGELTCC